MTSSGSRVDRQSWQGLFHCRDPSHPAFCAIVAAGSAARLLSKSLVVNAVSVQVGFLDSSVLELLLTE